MPHAHVAKAALALALLAAPPLATPALGQAPAAPYHVAKRLAVGGDGGWDYVVADTGKHRLFVTRGAHVMVLDTDRETARFGPAPAPTAETPRPRPPIVPGSFTVLVLER